MGYTTDFDGQFNLDKPLTLAHHAYLKAFAGSRRMKRADNPKLWGDRTCSLSNAVGLPLGKDACYYVEADDFLVTNQNDPPFGQPNLYCQWVPDELGTVIEWDGGEKFYDYIEWIKYLIQHFIAPWGYKLNGTVDWSGEEDDDLGQIVIKDNSVQILQGEVSYAPAGKPWTP